ncbi:heavy-metal-associated domain-containing protein [Tenacibaculum sp. XPcli2-G]|uniref:heavy-metal-associated domain-containing protein n=1 Tax=Tenacibaculum sp. XPcli2-G TaxID=2954503 RepID=UPI002098369B|nr:heavy metal-associated domain-containing protein [Tenacibaculum sp. XPcli2-G]MCO7186103.1 heavy-metal-associated domain-containing protein [Tenacibaculum sp. XPcli2-G]
MENNKELKFKTNLNCGGCVSKVQADLDNAEGICHWNVDTNFDDKVLTISSKGITADEVIAIVKSKGFKAEPLV